MASLHMVAKMQMMKERMDFVMNAFKGRVLNDLDELVHWTDSPFIAPITLFPLLAKFCLPQIEAYDESKDPLDHLKSSKHSCTYKVFRTRSYAELSQLH